MKTRAAGRFWLNIREQGFLGAGRVELLERIQATGSISAAARAMGMSYKAAWDAIEAMNNLSDRPLVLRQAGGSRGGGTRLTPFGERVIAHYRAAEVEYLAFLRRLDQGLSRLGDVAGFMRSLAMRTSARNQFQGTVSRITRGSTNDEVQVAIADGLTLTAIITHGAANELGLAAGQPVHVLADPTMVMLAEPQPGARYSARNRLQGTVIACRDGAVNGEVRIELAPGRVLTAVVTSESLAAPWLAPGKPVDALIKAQHLVLAVTP